MLTNKYLQIDNLHLKDGYFTVRCTKKTIKKIKIFVQKSGKILHYSINGTETIPCNMGTGKYTVTLYENTKASRYTAIGQVSFTANFDDWAPFSHPNQYVNYAKDSPCVRKAAELCKGLKYNLEKYAAISDYIDSHFVYDYIKSATTKGFALPDIDTCFKKKMGICQDLAAMAAAMLRSQGVACAFVIGYANKKYHAWVEPCVAFVFEYDPTKNIQHNKKKITYVKEREY